MRVERAVFPPKIHRVFGSSSLQKGEEKKKREKSAVKLHKEIKTEN
jgi:hypothetical protein